MPVIAQKSFARGEIAPTLYGRSDVPAWQAGLKTCRNFVVERHGVTGNRQGFQFIGQTKGAVNPSTGTSFARLVSSIRDLTTTYALEFGFEYVRVWKNGAPVSVVGSPAWSADTYAPAGSVWSYSGQYWYAIEEAINSTSTTLTLSGSYPSYTLTASAAIFSAPMVGQWIALHYPTATAVFTITGYTDSTHVTGTISGDLPSVATVPIVTWSQAVTPVAGPYWYQLPTTQMEFPTVYDDGDLQSIQITQSVDVLTLCHPSYAPIQIERYSDTRWAIVGITTVGSLPQPTGGQAAAGLPVSGGVPAAPSASASGGNSGSGPASWMVTTLTANAESELSASCLASVPDASHAATISWSAVAGAVAYAVYRMFSDSPPVGALAAIVTGTQYIDYGSISQNPTVRNIPADSSIAATTYNYLVTAVDDNGYESQSSGIFGCTGQTAWLTNNPPGAPPNTLSWTPVPGAISYNVYRERVAGSGTFGFIGNSINATFSDNAIEPDTTIEPSDVRTLFDSQDNYPGTSVYYQQRYTFACTIAQPEWVFMSRTGAFNNWSSSFPGVDSDAVIFQINGFRINPIRHLVNVRQLLAFTDNGIYSIQGNAVGEVTPTGIGAQQENYIGCSALLRPIVVGNSAIYMAARGNIVRDVRFDLYTNGYLGQSVSLYSQHLLDGYTLLSWTFQEVPNSIVWSVRSDGTLLGLTYIPEQQEMIVGWHHHDTANGLFDDVIALPEQTPNGGQQDMLYAIVSRIINDQSVRYIERMPSRLIIDPLSDQQFVDCSTQWDGRNAGTGTLALTGGTTWAETELLTLVSAPGIFSSGSVGAVYVLRDAAGDEVRVTVSAYVSATAVQGYASEAVPAGLQGIAVTTWSHCATTLAMPQLAGQQVSVLGDGAVLAWPDPAGESTTLPVSVGGVLTLPVPCEVATAGLPITADWQSLDPENPQPGQTFIERIRTVQKATLKLDQSGALLVGEDFTTMEELDFRTDEDADNPTALFSGTANYEFRNSYSYGGSVCIRQARPLATRLLNVAATVVLNDEE